jgi:1-acyl-sn-glycerol-3-phosphate acyltransferase
MISLGRIAARLLYGFEAHGIENIPATGPCILGCNHAGKLFSDMFVMLAIMPRRLLVVVAPEQMYRGFQGANLRARSRGEELAMRLLQQGVQRMPAIGARRLSGDSPVTQNLAMLATLQKGEAIFLAVEGEVEWDGRLNPARSGAPWLTLRSGAPFVPCGVTGTYDIWPRWEQAPRLTGKVIVRIGKPIQLTETTLEWIDEKAIVEAGQRIISEIGKLVGPGSRVSWRLGAFA